MPAATHLTASTLSSAHPGVPFDGTRIHTMPYGDPEPNDFQRARHRHRLAGPDSQRLPAVLIRYWPARHKGPRRAVDSRIPCGLAAAGRRNPHTPRLGDLVIMNPPFTNSTGQEAASIGVPAPSFAGFSTTHDEQRAMSRSLQRIRRHLRNPAGHGNAGLASNFTDLAHAKLKPGGVLALVMPLTAVSGGAWRPTRHLLATNYRDLTVVTIAATGTTERSFSSDTDIGEALIVGVKREEPLEIDESTADVLYVNLRRRPQSLAEASEIAHAVSGSKEEPVDLFRIGDDEAGCLIRATLAASGCASVSEPGVAELMLGLERGFLRLPRLGDPQTLPIAELAKLGDRGLVHRDINGPELSGQGPRGPFDVIPHRGSTAAYPVLWSHNAKRERRLLVDPDTEGRVRPNCDAKAVRVWETATRLHFTATFASTRRAWPPVSLPSAQSEVMPGQTFALGNWRVRRQRPSGRIQLWG